MRPRNAGFTLMELLIALAIFSILIAIVSVALTQILHTKTLVSKQASQLRKVQFAFMLLERDLLQAVNRPVRGEEARLFPGFIGRSHYIEMVRGGQVFLLQTDRKSSLLRVGYLCQNGQLIRRTFLQLDALMRAEYSDEVLLDKLIACHFAFLSRTQQLLPEWRSPASVQFSAVSVLPKAVQLTITLPQWGESVSVFPVAGAGYGVSDA